jgi:hypothetical protein
MKKIKVKTFIMNSQNPLHHDRLDARINNFIQENDIEVIDIKYSTCVYSNGCGGSWIPSAMLIYKENEQ